MTMIKAIVLITLYLSSRTLAQEQEQYDWSTCPDGWSRGPNGYCSCNRWEYRPGPSPELPGFHVQIVNNCTIITNLYNREGYACLPEGTCGCHTESDCPVPLPCAEDSRCGCRMNSDCPLGDVCDTENSRSCAECFSDDDCITTAKESVQARKGHLCENNTCICKAASDCSFENQPCASDSRCGCRNDTDCTEDRPFCDERGNLTCTDSCFTDKSCENIANVHKSNHSYRGGLLCLDGACSCASSEDCLDTNMPCAPDSKCGCLTESDCPEDSVCDEDPSGYCVNCNNDEDCGQKTYDMFLQNGLACQNKKCLCNTSDECPFPGQPCVASKCGCLDSTECEDELVCNVENFRTCVICRDNYDCRNLAMSHRTDIDFRGGLLCENEDCVCDSPSDCPKEGQLCTSDDSHCGCRDTTDCPEDRSICNEAEYRVCVECKRHNDCPDDSWCDFQGECVECLSTEHCNNDLVCISGTCATLSEEPSLVHSVGLWVGIVSGLLGIPLAVCTYYQFCFKKRRKSQAKRIVAISASVDDLENNVRPVGDNASNGRDHEDDIVDDASDSISTSVGEEAHNDMPDIGSNEKDPKNVNIENALAEAGNEHDLENNVRPVGDNASNGRDLEDDIVGDASESISTSVGEEARNDMPDIGSNEKDPKTM